MNLQNTKVYTTDKEVIRKYGELVGVDFSKRNCQGAAICYAFKSKGNFYTAVYKTEDDLKEITPDQINALYAEKFGDNNSGKQLHELPEFITTEWKNGDKCTYDGSEYIFVGMTPNFNDVSCIIFDPKNGIEHVSVGKLRKPETEAERKERERNEWIDLIIGYIADVPAPYAKRLLGQLYDAGMREFPNL